MSKTVQARKQPLTPIQKILIAHGGVGHSVLRHNSRNTYFKLTNKNRRKAEAS